MALKQLVFTLLALSALGPAAFCQLRIEGNANVDLELSRAGDKSHFYYNEIHESHQGWSSGQWVSHKNWGSRPRSFRLQLTAHY